MSSLLMVLLVDDEEYLLVFMCMMFEDEFDCLMVLDVDEVIWFMEENFVQVIFCDYWMLGIMGIEFLFEVCKKWLEMVCIVIIGYIEINDMIVVINEVGVYQFLMKFWYLDYLMMVVKNVVQLF